MAVGGVLGAGTVPQIASLQDYREAHAVQVSPYNSAAIDARKSNGEAEATTLQNIVKTFHYAKLLA
jgi:hypothetical protein